MKLVIDGQTVEVPGGGGSDFPSGGIIIWSGAADNIPSGWALCDGQNNTPDLRGKFVLGAGTSHAVGTTGGEENVTLTMAQMPSHNHPIINASGSGSATGIAYRFAQSYSSTQIDRQTVGQVGGSQPHDNMPPYYVLCYIMKL